MRKITDKGLRRKADQLWQQINALTKRCLICGQPNQVGHHFIPKSCSSYLRYSLKNMIPLCSSCHFRLHFSGDPIYERTIEQKKGKEWADELERDKHEYCKTNRFYYEEQIERLTQILANGEKE
jgi:5-methylcytosine-specific restriction endonuclease McrA